MVERLSYDAWGKRRFASGADDPTGSITSLTTRGFTGQEELSVASLVHLNGRVYDPFLGRMLSADPVVPDAANPQAWNRYSYVANDPLAFTDPSGYSWLSQFFHGVVHFLQTHPLLRSILQIAVTAALFAILPELGFTGAALAGLSAAGGSAIVGGLSGGRLGDILRNAVIAGATAIAFFGVGEATGALAGSGQHSLSLADIEAHPDAFAFQVAGHAAVGCGQAVVSHGHCGSGALSAAVGALSGPILPTQNFIASLVISAALGGAASAAVGGNFANGAVTAAFGYLFNSLGKSATSEEGDTRGLRNETSGEGPPQVALNLLLGAGGSAAAGDHIRALTARHPIKPTSRCCLSAWQPNPGRCSTYRCGESVQTTGTTSSLSWKKSLGLVSMA